MVRDGSWADGGAMTATTGPQSPAADHHSASPAARRRSAALLLTLLVLASVALVLFQWWEPPFTGRLDFDTTVGLGAAYWPMNVLLGGPAFAVTFVVAAIFLAVLGDLRWPALLASTGLALAGLLFALVINAEVLPFAWAADPATVDPDTGRAMFVDFNAALDGFGVYVLGSMLAIAAFVLAAVVWAAVVGGLPRWMVAVVAALLVAEFGLPLGQAGTVVLALVERIVWVLIGWFGYRRMVRPHSVPDHGSATRHA